MKTTRDQALTMARQARTLEEVERAMVSLAQITVDDEVAAARSALDVAFDRAQRAPGGRDAFEAARSRDIDLNPGADNN